MSYQVICVLGSSTANGYWDDEGWGWVGRLSHQLAKDYPYQFGFNNLAMAGDRSVDILHRLSVEAIPRDPDILIFSGGGNDLNRWGAEDAKTTLSEAASKEAWLKIFELAKLHVKKILVMGLTPIQDGPYIGGPDSKTMYKFNKDNEHYNRNLQQWCKEAGIPFLGLDNIWPISKVGEYLYDAVHPNAKGHQLICDRVLNEMRNLGYVV